MTVAPVAARVIPKVAVTSAPAAYCLVYRTIVALVIRRVGVTAATATARADNRFCNSRVWIRHGQEYSSWSWGGYLAVLGDMQ